MRSNTIKNTFIRYFTVTVKRLTLLITLLICVSNAHAWKNCIFPSHEVGIGFFKYSFATPNENVIFIPFVARDNYSQERFAFNKSFVTFPEIYYSYRIGVRKIRSTFYMTDYKEYSSFYTETYNYRKTQFNLGLGIQQDFFKTKMWTPYILFDFITQYNMIDKIPTEPSPNPFPIVQKEENNSQFQLDGRIGLGFTTFFHQQKYSASFEAAYTMKDEAFFPISRLSINYHF